MKQKEELSTKEGLENLDTKVDKIGIQVGKNSKTIDKNSEAIDNLAIHVAKNTKAINKNSKAIDRVGIQVIKNSEAIDKMVTKDEFNEFREEMLSGQDKMMTILQRLDQERVFTVQWIERIETDVDRNKNEIKGIKLKLAIP